MNKPPLQYKLYAAQDRGAREYQQDTVNSSLPELQADIGVLCVLSDGMGGLEEGARASRAVADTMVSTFHRSSITDTPEQILLRGCLYSQQAVKAIQNEIGKNVGATLAAVLLRNGRCSFLSVGDSRIYLFRCGTLIQLTRDQNRRNRIEMQIGLGRMPEAARTDAMGNALTFYIGKEEPLRTDRGARSFRVGPGDRILLVSDGVYTTLPETEISSIMAVPGEAVTWEMIMRVMSKNVPSQDNCTAAVIDCLPVIE